MDRTGKVMFTGMFSMGILPAVAGIIVRGARDTLGIGHVIAFVVISGVILSCFYALLSLADTIAMVVSSKPLQKLSDAERRTDES